VVEPILEVATDDAPRAVEALTGAPGILEAAMFGRALHVTVDEAAAGEARIRGLLTSAGRSVDGVRPVPPALEDVFVSLVRAEGGALVG